MSAIWAGLMSSGFLGQPGFYAIVDGQFGSTGKGLLASVLAEHMHDMVDIVTSNAGPNSGHTSYHGDQKVVLCQLPTFSVMSKLMHNDMPLTFLNAGMVVDVSRLRQEVEQYAIGEETKVLLHENACVVNGAHTTREQDMKNHIGSTGKGTGAAIAAKVMRMQDTIAKEVIPHHETPPALILVEGVDLNAAIRSGNTVLCEVSQGFSLSLNAANFYPFCTSRDCTVGQAMSDAGVHPTNYRDCAMVVRTYPIRVGGTSGPCYEDQKEIEWSEIGVGPELTTVTQKQRRLFTWSKTQFMDAVSANRPGVLLVNFMNYLPKDIDENDWLKENVIGPYIRVMGRTPSLVLLGRGPKNSDVEVMQWK